MRRLNDEILMAYADGTLTEVDVRHVEAELTRDASARRMVTLYRTTAALAWHAYEWPMWSEPPRRLVLAIEKPRSTLRTMQAWPMWLANLSSIGGTVAAVSFWLLVVGPSPHRLSGSQDQLHGQPKASATSVAAGGVPGNSELARVLVRIASSSAGHMDRRFTLVATLTDKWGNTCQEVDARTGTPDGPPAIDFVGCSPSGGQWTIVDAGSPLITIDSRRLEAYVRFEATAHDALSGVLTMIGAGQRASALQPETTQR